MLLVTLVHAEDGPMVTSGAPKAHCPFGVGHTLASLRPTPQPGPAVVHPSLASLPGSWWK